MAAIVSEFFGISGIDAVPPANMAELIPYLLQVTVAIVLVLAVYKVLLVVLQSFCGWRWRS